MTTQKNITIIGAGAAGLMAAKELSSSGYHVTILEANSKAGGRVCTDVENKFGMPVEPGAEFIHGNLPVTLKLLKQANIEYKPMSGNMVRVTNGQLSTTDEFGEYWHELMQRMDALEEDMTIQDFLTKYFNHEKYAQIRQTVQGFAEGYDLADITKAAVLPLKKEWMHEDEKQYRVTGGYIRLTEYLVRECLNSGVIIHYNCRATAITLKKDKVTIASTANKTFVTTKIIVAVSAGILQSGQLKFFPAMPKYMEAANEIGFGSVIKILLQFKTPFWKNLSKKVGFILSNEIIPTWWTQLPDENTLLTGWLGGPKAYKYSNKSSGEIIQLSLQSLSSILSISVEKLQKDLLHGEVYNWSDHPYTLGGYSYNTLLSEHAKQILNTPVHDTLFFAGEALYTGDAQATVEAALQSGADVAAAILKL